MTPCCCSLALPYMCHTTLLDVPLHFPTCAMLRCLMFSCTSYMRHAKLHDVLLHFPTWAMLRCLMFSCASLHCPTCVKLRCLMFFPTVAQFLANQGCQKAWLPESKDLAACASLAVALGRLNLPQSKPADSFDLPEEPKVKKKKCRPL